MDNDAVMRWTRRSASRDADGCLWAGYAYGLGGRLISENDSDNVHPFLRAAQHSYNRAPRGSPRLHV